MLAVRLAVAVVVVAVVAGVVGSVSVAARLVMDSASSWASRSRSTASKRMLGGERYRLVRLESLHECAAARSLVARW